VGGAVGHIPKLIATGAGEEVVVAAVEDVVAFVVVGVACFPPPLEHPAMRRAATTIVMAGCRP